MNKKRFLEIGAGIFIVAILLLSSGVLAAIQEEQQAYSEVAYAYDGENYLETLKTDVPDFGEIYTGQEPTDWTPDGVYVGVWGIKTGSTFKVLGYLAGYYKGSTQGSYIGVWNTTDNSKTGLLAGRFWSIVTLGWFNETSKNQKIPFVGFCLKNTTHFAGKMMPLIGNQILYVYGRHHIENGMDGQVVSGVTQSQSSQSSSQQSSSSPSGSSQQSLGSTTASTATATTISTTTISQSRPASR
jgi:hypothetical protein